MSELSPEQRIEMRDRAIKSVAVTAALAVGGALLPLTTFVVLLGWGIKSLCDSEDSK